MVKAQKGKKDRETVFSEQTMTALGTAVSVLAQAMLKPYLSDSMLQKAFPDGFDAAAAAAAGAAQTGAGSQATGKKDSTGGPKRQGRTPRKNKYSSYNLFVAMISHAAKKPLDMKEAGKIWGGLPADLKQSVTGRLDKVRDVCNGLIAEELAAQPGSNMKGKATKMMLEELNKLEAGQHLQPLDWQGMLQYGEAADEGADGEAGAAARGQERPHKKHKKQQAEDAAAATATAGQPVTGAKKEKKHSKEKPAEAAVEQPATTAEKKKKHKRKQEQEAAAAAADQAVQDQKKHRKHQETSAEQKAAEGKPKKHKKNKQHGGKADQ